MMTMTSLWLLAATALASEATAQTETAEPETAAEVTAEPVAQESTNPFVQQQEESKKKGGGGGLVPVAGLFGFVFCGFCAWKRYQRGMVGLNAPTQVVKVNATECVTMDSARGPQAMEEGQAQEVKKSRVDGKDSPRLSDVSTVDAIGSPSAV